MYLIYKKLNLVTAIIFLLGLLSCSIFIVGQSISEVSVFLIARITSIILLLQKNTEKNIGIIFFISGSCTAFSDLLTVPLIAILILYRKELISIIKDFFSYLKTKNKKYKTNYNYVWKIIVATIPASIIGLLLKDFIEEYFKGKIIGLMFIITALLLYKIKDKKGHKSKKDITYLDALKIGLFQVIALFPGISRSATTLTGGLSQDLNRDTALNFSFMLYIPISIASFILSISDINIGNLFIPYLLSMIASSIVTYFSAKLFINLVKKGELIYFYVYCFTIGVLVFLTF